MRDSGRFEDPSWWPLRRALLGMRSCWAVAGRIGLALCCALVAATGVWASEPAVALVGARILSVDGPVIQRGTLVLRGEKIIAVGPDVEVPEGVERVEVRGATLTPGLIDVWSALALDQAGGSAHPLRRAEDGFDRYATAELSEALSQGVTAVYVSPIGPVGIRGTGAVIRLVPAGGGEAIGRVLKGRAALSIDLGSAARPIARLKVLNGIRKQFRQAIQYRKSLEEYEEKLAEYKKKLREQGPKKKERAGKRDDESASATAFGAEPKKGEEKEKEGEEAEELKKPRRPNRQPRLEVLLEALDGRMPVRVSAYRSSDILNALELGRDFSLDLILEGATEAHLVADRVAEAGVPVVLAPLDRDMRRRDDLFRRFAFDAPAVLAGAGVRWVVGSGMQSGRRTRFVAMQAELAGGRGARGDPLRWVTADAAELLGVADWIGRLRRGLLADVVVWSGDPLDPASHVLRVYVGGELAYQAKGHGEKGKGK